MLTDLRNEKFQISS